MVAPRRGLLAAASTLALAGAATELDLSRVDAHLSKVDGCLRALPQSAEASIADCTAFEDAALERCDRAFGGQLESCMAAAEARPVPESELLPELRQLRRDLLSCYEDDGIRTRMVGKMMDPLSRCGFTQFHGMVPDVHIEDAEAHLREFVRSKELFSAHFQEVHRPEEAASDLRMHDLPLNLPGGRFEAVPPATGNMVSCVDFLSSHFNLPQRLERVWPGSATQLSYVLVRSQHEDTTAVSDMDWTLDVDSAESMRLSVAVHDAGHEAGQEEYLPTTHRLHRHLRLPSEAFPRGRAIATERSDLIFHFGRTRHRGTQRKGEKPCVTLDLVLHSGRFPRQRAAEEAEQQLVRGEAAAAATRRFRQLWQEILDRNARGEAPKMVHYRAEPEL